MTATRLRVERQIHLPASRDEAWLALQSLVPEERWDESAHIFSALENIYRCVSPLLLISCSAARLAL